jgi:hypothetical protein
MATYSFLEVNAALVGPGGAINLGQGSAASEEGITISPSNDINTMAVGADGTPMHSLSADKSGSVTITLLKTSPVNAKLSALFALQTAAPSTHGQNTISLATTNGGDVVTCQLCAFKRAPDLKYAKDGGTNEWVFDAGIIDRTLGGLI